MTKKTKHPDLDDPLFRREMADVVPLKARPTTASRPPRKPVPGHRASAPVRDTDMQMPGQSNATTRVISNEESSHRKNGIQNRTMQRLRRGRFRIAAELDLHSMTVATARSVLLDFIADAHAGSKEAVRIIHGKGLRSDKGPRLKQMTRQVLQDHPLVLAYINCKPADGGDGAVDVLLKSP